MFLQRLRAFPLQKASSIYTFTVVLLLLLASCTPTQKVIYLNDLTTVDTAFQRGVVNFETPIQKNDLLWITIAGSNEADLAILNSGNGAGNGISSNTIGNNGSILGYLVESDGSIKIPYLGKVKAEGLTRLQLEKQLTEQFKDYTRNPIVNVRFMNYSYSVLGEVTRAGRYNMSTERITILDALGMAGDITELGRRDNVMIIREVSGERQIARLNLLSKDVLKSPFYYLKTNDIVYVEPVKAKFISRTGLPQYLSLVAVGLSLILTIINLRK